MAFIIKDTTALINTQLTDVGRRKISQGNFNVAYFQLGDSEFNMAEGEYGRDLIRFRIQYSHTVPDHSFDVIYISEELITKLSKLFSIPDFF